MKPAAIKIPCAVHPKPLRVMAGISLVSYGVIIALSLSACSFAPKYKQPMMSIPAHYKETGQWIKLQAPAAFTQSNLPWWTLFHDNTLNALENQVTSHNQNLKIALAQYQKALAYAQEVRSNLYPAITGVGTVARQQSAKNAANSGTSKLLFNTFLLGADFNYEVDAWGRVRNAVIASNNLAKASEFDLAAVDLSLHAELANDYFQLRGFDESQRLLDTTVIAYQKALYLTQQRHQGGIVPITDVDQAITQVENAKTLAADNQLKRAQLEHAIAVLIGQAPANFTLASKKIRQKPVVIAPDLPSSLLAHRPDIAAAERRVQAANASIGVAIAAFFPEFNLISLIGYQSDKLSNLFSAPSLFWSLGPSTAMTLIQPELSVVIFDGYKLQAQLKYAKASYFETVSQYRQTVLTAFQEVEDALVAIHRLKQEHHSQAASTVAAKDAWFQENQRYKGGIATFLDVVVTENQALQSELALIDIKTRQQLSCVQLIKALGGGWQL
ncbi:MAG: efflux transporter outer membrane subunit [Legionellales bacterium]